MRLRDCLVCCTATLSFRPALLRKPLAPLGRVTGDATLLRCTRTPDACTATHGRLLATLPPTLLSSMVVLLACKLAKALRWLGRGAQQLMDNYSTLVYAQQIRARLVPSHALNKA